MRYLSVLLCVIALSCQTLPDKKDTHAAGRVIDQTRKQEFVEYCKTHECRKNTHFKLKKKDGSYFEYTSEIDPPVVQPKFISIYPGETLFIEADIEGDLLINLKHVKTVERPEKTMKLSF